MRNMKRSLCWWSENIVRKKKKKNRFRFDFKWNSVLRIVFFIIVSKNNVSMAVGHGILEYSKHSSGGNMAFCVYCVVALSQNWNKQKKRTNENSRDRNEFLHYKKNRKCIKDFRALPTACAFIIIQVCQYLPLHSTLLKKKKF